jgi:mRNA-degrading endonuclease RelE of RelBE toxin-antitoxin system
MSILKQIAALVEKLNVAEEWSNAETFKGVKFIAEEDCFSYQTTGQDKNKARFKKGVYRHIATVDNKQTTMYVGKAEGVKSSIANRQTSHCYSFKTVDSTSEMSGKKYRNYLRECELKELDILIEYVDMTHMPRCMIPMFERLSIDYFNPKINQ